jgi:hypothetical protein
MKVVGRPAAFVNGRIAVALFDVGPYVPIAPVSQDRHPCLRLRNAWLELGASRDELMESEKVWWLRCWDESQFPDTLESPDIYILVCHCCSRS